MKQSRICMLDLEMSGLEPDKERIIEVACFVVEADLTPVEGAEMCLAVMPDDPGVLDTMDDWNTRTHGESGLIRRIAPNGPRCHKRSDHTALADARGSLDELKFYVDNYLDIE